MASNSIAPAISTTSAIASVSNCHNVEPHSISSSLDLDVYVRQVTLHNNPARLHINVEVGSLSFFSDITYHSIPHWDDIWQLPTIRQADMLGAIVAWDCMRFMALGGDRLVLCAGLTCTDTVKQLWSECFRHQFGEWRYLNRIQYPTPAHPLLVTSEPSQAEPFPSEALQAVDTPTRQTQNPELSHTQSPANPTPTQRWLLANGGGKDTLAGMILLNERQTPYDLYEGYMPVGGDHDLQRHLLERLRNSAAPQDAKAIAISVKDNFYSTPATLFEQAGVTAGHYKTDFVLGHTANYPGYFPLILYHQYTRVWFNIEKSADDTQVTWNGDAINHQWCKSMDYQQKSLRLFWDLTQCYWFEGFDSTLRGLYDVSIYQIVAQYPALLKLTHSCNYGKPWCIRCPKCCFCYLMMCAMLGEDYAMDVVGATVSLFEMPENQQHWRNLLAHDHVAWECVPSYAECQLAAHRCLERGIRYPVLERFVITPEKAKQLQAFYGAVDWDVVPSVLAAAIATQLESAPIPDQLMRPLDRAPSINPINPPLAQLIAQNGMT